jgi:hypothetical protein
MRFCRLQKAALKQRPFLIVYCRDYKSILLRHYALTKPIRAKKIARNELKDFKLSIDNLRESYEDLESVFFLLPAMPEFEETTKILSLV